MKFALEGEGDSHSQLAIVLGLHQPPELINPAFRVGSEGAPEMSQDSMKMSELLQSCVLQKVASRGWQIYEAGENQSTFSENRSEMAFPLPFSKITNLSLTV